MKQALERSITVSRRSMTPLTSKLYNVLSKPHLQISCTASTIIIPSLIPFKGAAVRQKISRLLSSTHSALLHNRVLPGGYITEAVLSLSLGVDFGAPPEVLDKVRSGTMGRRNEPPVD